MTVPFTESEERVALLASVKSLASKYCMREIGSA